MRPIFALLAGVALCAALAGPHAQASPSEPPAFTITGATVTMTQATHDEVLGSLTDILMQAAATPVYDKDGDMVGYELTDIDKGSAFDIGGLKDGDVVLQIADVPLTTPQVALDMLKYVRSQQDFTYLVTHGRSLKNPRIRWHVLTL